MNRLTRITSILIQLQSKKIVIAREIADRFDISLRTVYRDIKTLQDAGVPIGSENGLGYFIVDGYRLPPVSLTEEEANTLIISEELIKQQGDKSFNSNYSALLIKIKSTLKNFQKEKLELLENRTFSFVKDKIIESNWLSEIQKAISNSSLLEIEYHSIYNEKITVRRIEPMAVYFTNSVWLVISFCQLRNELREFRLDRIIRVKLTQETFKSNTEFSLQKYFRNFQF
ncbi:helix-turn-helix transcriptional regulator [Muriicola sp. Z0-33]|uniref:helix-turn-helix transcriptional regulator n=1 Tax=Muriicola sp. Z0-33 TaxID=2816957 RepID=UPI0022385E42|nr:YafY family protein [Muriicola sp. Z0-33]MCW5518120.1 YafY family transcriptional regulator [Muriicola sp. Z0-33]